MLFPVNNVMAEPIKNNPIELEIALAIIAGIPLKKKNGKSGNMAPIANNTNEEIAASIRQNSDNSRVTDQIAGKASLEAKDGGQNPRSRTRT